MTEATKPAIMPSIGRVVWYFPDGHSREAQPLSAQIAYVHSDTMVNLGYFDQNGIAAGQTSVRLLAPGEKLPETGHVAMWMPYQIAQAAK